MISALQFEALRSMGSAALHGNVRTATTTAAPLDTAQACAEVLLQADPANTDSVLVGNAIAQPLVLAAGAGVVLPAGNVNLVYVKAASGTQTVNYLAA